jgi:hypothetical protein
MIRSSKIVISRWQKERQREFSLSFVLIEQSEEADLGIIFLFHFPHPFCLFD